MTKVESARPAPNQQRPLAVNPREAATLLGVSHAHFRRHVLAELRIVRSGQRILIPVCELEAWLDRESSPVLPEELARGG